MICSWFVAGRARTQSCRPIHLPSDECFDRGSLVGLVPAQPGVVDHALRLPLVIAVAEHASEDCVDRRVAAPGVDELEKATRETR